MGQGDEGRGSRRSPGAWREWGPEGESVTPRETQPRTVADVGKWVRLQRTEWDWTCTDLRVDVTVL